MKFKKKAAKLSMILGFKRKLSPSPSQTPEKPTKKMMKQVSYFLDKKVHSMNQQLSKLLKINPGKERFDRIAGDKEVFLTHTLNYAYLSTSPLTLFFKLGSQKSDTIHARLRLQWISKIGSQGMTVEIFLYK